MRAGAEREPEIPVGSKGISCTLQSESLEARVRMEQEGMLQTF